MARRQAQVPQAQRLLQPDLQPVLVTAGHQADPGGRADRGVGIGLHEAQTLGCEAVDVRRLVVRPAVAADVGVAEVVGQQEDDVGLARPGRPGGAGGEQGQPGGGGRAAQHAPAMGGPVLRQGHRKALTFKVFPTQPPRPRGH